MLFNSYEYLLWFLPATLVVFFLLGRRPLAAQAWLTLASLFFYGWWNPWHLPLIAGSIAFNFAVATALRRGAGGRMLAFGVAANLALLGVFKYADFFLANAARVTGDAPHLLHLALPLGISFFTFTQIAYLVDVHRRKAQEPVFVNYALFVTFFPHLLAGPILHHSEMMPQFAEATNKRPQWDNLAAGLFLLAIGLVKKVLIADTFAPIADAGFAAPATLAAPAAWAAVLAYTMQIYFDFSGYTDMALGAARMFNIRMPINFDSPYRATDIREFWHRWHITLSRFLREYLYIPLGGNRGAELHTAANILATFLLGGLWHGAAWTFVLWGLLHGVAMIVCRAWGKVGVPLPRALAWALTFLFVMVSWVFFRATSLEGALAMLSAMAGGNPAPALPALAWLGETATRVAAALAVPPAWALVPPAIGLLVVFRRANSNALAQSFRPTVGNGAFVALAIPLCVLQLARVTPFLYFNF
jgi:D-alanyl-lipoteichoic acid acyltransferase DltB (MBOAT superfamily)